MGKRWLMHLDAFSRSSIEAPTTATSLALELKTPSNPYKPPTKAIKTFDLCSLKYP